MNSWVFTVRARLGDADTQLRRVSLWDDAALLTTAVPYLKNVDLLLVTKWE